MLVRKYVFDIATLFIWFHSFFQVNTFVFPIRRKNRLLKSEMNAFSVVSTKLWLSIIAAVNLVYQ